MMIGLSTEPQMPSGFYRFHARHREIGRVTHDNNGRPLKSSVLVFRQVEHRKPGKWTGAQLREIRKRNGVGRPARKMVDA